MEEKEARVLLELGQDFDPEELNRNYISRYIECFRLKSGAITIREVEQLEQVLVKINQSYGLFCDIPTGYDDQLQLSFNLEQLKTPSVELHKASGNFERKVENLIELRELGLAIRLLEIGISQSIIKDNLTGRVNISDSVRLLGKVMMQCGLIDQGMAFRTFGMKNFEKGMVYIETGDHEAAVHHLAIELNKNESGLPVDEICQMMATSYFLLNDYQNALDIIEVAMPGLIPKKDIFLEQCRSKDFALIMLLSIDKFSGIKNNMLNALKLRVKYPLCFKYFQNCFGSINNAFDHLYHMRQNPEAYDTFLSKLQHQPAISEDINLHYDIQDLQTIYYEIFNMPLQKSLLYHPK